MQYIDSAADYFACTVIIDINLQVPLATIPWKQGRDPCIHLLNLFVLVVLVAPYLCHVSLVHLVDGLSFDFQQGVLFPQNGPKRSKDSAFLAELQQALTMMEDLIKSCELAVDLAAVTGCPVCAIASVGTSQQKAGTRLQR